MKAVGILLQLALFLTATFAFIVLLDHGTKNFPENAAVEWRELTTLATGSGG